MGYCLVPNSNREATHILLACNISVGNYQYFGQIESLEFENNTIEFSLVWRS